MAVRRVAGAPRRDDAASRGRHLDLAPVTRRRARRPSRRRPRTDRSGACGSVPSAACGLREPQHLAAVGVDHVSRRPRGLRRDRGTRSRRRVVDRAHPLRAGRGVRGRRTSPRGRRCTSRGWGCRPGPGAMQLTRMRSSASSYAHARVRYSSAAFVDPYSMLPGLTIEPTDELTFTTAASGDARSAGKRRREQEERPRDVDGVVLLERLARERLERPVLGSPRRCSRRRRSARRRRASRPRSAGAPPVRRRRGRDHERRRSRSRRAPAASGSGRRPTSTTSSPVGREQPAAAAPIPVLRRSRSRRGSRQTSP